MQIDTLKEFLTLSVTRNFSEAAMQLNVSQPTLSRHIQALEKELRCQLVVRTMPLSLTVAGEKILGDVQSIISAYDSMLETVRTSQRQRSRAVAVQNYSFVDEIFKRIVRAQAEVEVWNPGVTFRNVDPVSGKTLFQMIEKGLFSVGFIHGFEIGGVETLPEIPDGFEARKVPQLCGGLAFGHRRDLLVGGESLGDEARLLSDFADARFLSPLERYLDSFREAFSNFCRKTGGFSPKFDFQPMYSHRHFYLQDPGESMFIYTMIEQEGDTRSYQAELLVRTPVRDCFFNTYALYLKDVVDEYVEAFVDVLCEPVAGLPLDVTA